MKDLLIVIPAYREQHNILILCKKLLSISTTKYRLKILIIDDSDNLITQRLIISSKLKNKIFLIKRSKKSGRGSAILRGMKFFIEKNNRFSTMVEMDADLSHDPNELIRNINFFYSKKLDLLISSRYLKKSKIINWPYSRKILSFLSNKLAKFLLKIPVSDYTNGYRVYSSKAVSCCLKNCGKIGDGFIILSEILLNIHNSKLKIAEIHSTFKNRIRGESSVSKGEIMNSIIGLMKLYKIKLKMSNY